YTQRHLRRVEPHDGSLHSSQLLSEELRGGEAKVQGCIAEGVGPPPGRLPPRLLRRRLCYQKGIHL
ncbi:unnamed protein product, partial [Prorocentrum cordatum]